MMSDATMVALGEATHCAKEPLEFRNRLFQYLVEEKNFTAIAIESGLVEGRLVHDYVRGETGNLDAVLAQGLSWTFDRLPQNRTLIEWLRAYNADPRHARKVSFYGFDVPGSPGAPRANRGPETALVATLEYLERVDRASAASFRARLIQAEQDTRTAAIADLVALLERKEARYTALSTAHDYMWAYRGALGARQVDNWSRLTIEPAAQLDVRDRAQADNLEWIIDQEGPLGKVLVFAHWAHLSCAPVKISWFPKSDEAGQQVAGTYLRRRLGKRLLTLGHVIGTSSGSIADSAREVGVSTYLLDLRDAPAAVAAWLNQEHSLHDGPHVFKTVVGRAFDAIFYTDAVTSA